MKPNLRQGNQFESATTLARRPQHICSAIPSALCCHTNHLDAECCAVTCCCHCVCSCRISKAPSSLKHPPVRSEVWHPSMGEVSISFYTCFLLQHNRGKNRGSKNSNAAHVVHLHIIYGNDLQYIVHSAQSVQHIQQMLVQQISAVVKST